MLILYGADIGLKNEQDQSPLELTSEQEFIDQMKDWHTNRFFGLNKAKLQDSLNTIFGKGSPNFFKPADESQPVEINDQRQFADLAIISYKP
jgi:hypothetical protein